MSWKSFAPMNRIRPLVPVSSGTNLHNQSRLSKPVTCHRKVRNSNGKKSNWFFRQESTSCCLYEVAGGNTDIWIWSRFNDIRLRNRRSEKGLAGRCSLAKKTTARETMMAKLTPSKYQCPHCNGLLDTDKEQNLYCHPFDGCGSQFLGTEFLASVGTPISGNIVIIEPQENA